MKGKNYLEEKKVHQWHIFALQSFHKRGSLLLPKAKDMEFMLKQNWPFPSWGLGRSRAIRCGHDAVEVSIRGCKCADPARLREAREARGARGEARIEERQIWGWECQSASGLFASRCLVTAACSIRHCIGVTTCQFFPCSVRDYFWSSGQGAKKGETINIVH